MKGIIFWLVSASLSLGPSAFGFAPVVDYVGNPFKTISVSGETVDVYREAEIRLPGQIVTVRLSGAGVRRKKVGFFTVNAYIATSFTETPFHSGDPMADLKDSDAELIVLTMVRDITASQIRTEIDAALGLNNVDTSRPEIAKIVQGFPALPSGSEVILVSYIDEFGEDQISVSLPNFDLKSSAPNIGLDFWSPWFGQSLDSELAELKSDLMAGGYGNLIALPALREWPEKTTFLDTRF